MDDMTQEILNTNHEETNPEVDSTMWLSIAPSTTSPQAPVLKQLEVGLEEWREKRNMQNMKKTATRRASTRTSDAWLFDLAVSAGLRAVLDRRAPAPLVRSEAQPGLRWNSNAGTTEGLGGAWPS